ncbi:hypothetical protein [Mesorhizobium sp.]|uniref:hypothetical protein n=1 Tax=Mesorhizobium sp. TaxID=1871066 RepID=UPI000FE5AD82|nr:hypothetical protein [Mesorhizobium sp.]RWA83918.1 MAG: hypothetical protein EOQ30_11325 [Mesorhizobium sp.]
MTQRESNRNLSASLPKRFGFFDLAIELTGSQEACGTNRFKFSLSRPESALQHAFWRRSSNFCFKLPWAATKVILSGEIVSLIGSIQIQSALRLEAS